MSELRLFRDESGEICVYPLFVTYPSGYDIIVYDDWTDDEIKRREKAARREAAKKWAALYGDDETFIEERATWSETIRHGVKEMIRVRFKFKPTEQRAA